MKERFVLMNLSKHKSWRAMKTDQTYPVCLHTTEKYGKVYGIASKHRVIMKQQVKNEYMKRKQTCSLCFVNAFKFQDNKFKIVQKNF